MFAHVISEVLEKSDFLIQVFWKGL